jgi:RimJ/RimL family protein N-acetyltransferase
MSAARPTPIEFARLARSDTRPDVSRPTLKPLLRSLARQLRGGDAIAIRPIRSDDGERLLRAFHGLDRRSIYQRFFFVKSEMSEKELRQLTECDGIRTAVLVAIVGSGAEERIVGLGEYARRGTVAHVAFAVEEDFQGRGIAGRLLRRLIRIAREHGIEQLEADVLSDNAPMLAVFRHAGLPFLKTEADGVVHVTLPLSDPPR